MAATAARTEQKTKSGGTSLRLNHTEAALPACLPGEQSVRDKATKVSCDYNREAAAQLATLSMHVCDACVRWRARTYNSYDVCDSAVARGARKSPGELATFEVVG